LKDPSFVKPGVNSATLSWRAGTALAAAAGDAAGLAAAEGEAPGLTPAAGLLAGDGLPATAGLLAGAALAAGLAGAVVGGAAVGAGVAGAAEQAVTNAPASSGRHHRIERLKPERTDSMFTS
jgi:hypothetical protein